MNKHNMQFPAGYSMHSTTSYHESGNMNHTTSVLRVTNHATAYREFRNFDDAYKFVMSPQGERFGGPLEIVEMEPPASNLRTSPAMRERILAAI